MRSAAVLLWFTGEDPLAMPDDKVVPRDQPSICNSISPCTRTNHVDIFRLVRALFITTIPDLKIGRGKTRTFKPRRDVPEGTKQYQLRKYAEATLVRSPCTTLYVAN